MPTQVIGTSLFHKVPKDLQEVLKSNHDVFQLWNGLTPLARNEWVCWVTMVKKEETRQVHLKRFCEDLRKESVGRVVGRVALIVGQVQKSGSKRHRNDRERINPLFFSLLAQRSSPRTQIWRSAFSLNTLRSSTIASVSRAQ
jgi:hypothetical protein